MVKERGKNTLLTRRNLRLFHQFQLLGRLIQLFTRLAVYFIDLVTEYRLKGGLLFCLSLFTVSVQAHESFLQLHGGWQYRWGDSPFDIQGRPEWALQDIANGAWQEIDFPSNPPGRDGRSNVWFRIVLPNGNWHDPVIYIYSVDLIVQVYLDGRKIYQYGYFDQNGQGRFEGWPWHMIQLPADFAGKSLYFRVFSDYSDIGLWGEVKLMERLDLIKLILEHSVEQIIVSGFSLLIAGLAFVFALLQAERRSFFYLALFALASALMVFGQSQVKLWLFNAPLFWDHLAATGYFLLPVAMALLFGEWCAGSKYQTLIALLWRFHLGYAIGANVLPLLGYSAISRMYFVFDGIFAISLTLLFAVAFSRFRHVNNEQKFIIVTFAFFNLLLLLDMVVAHSILAWQRIPLAWGLLSFSLALISISLYHFVQTQTALKRLNATLEQKVKDRTRELELLATRDPLTNIMNRRAFYQKGEPIFRAAMRYKRNLSVIVLDIDHFKHFNDAYGHAVGDQVLVMVADCFRKNCRDSDFAARFGGEEFVLLLEEADSHSAVKFAERLRISVAELRLPDIKQTITASLGIACLKPETQNLDELIIRADRALYEAKHSGRNRCCYL